MRILRRRAVAGDGEGPAGSELNETGNAVATANAAHAIATARGPKRSIAGPATSSIAGIDPSETKSSAAPSPPFDAPVACCTLGRTDAQAPQKTPRPVKPASEGRRRG